MGLNDYKSLKDVNVIYEKIISSSQTALAIAGALRPPPATERLKAAVTQIAYTDAGKLLRLPPLCLSLLPLLSLASSLYGVRLFVHRSLYFGCFSRQRGEIFDLLLFIRMKVGVFVRC